MRKILLLATLLTFGYANCQPFVSTTPENRKVILEEFTGVNCVYCPQGHTIANNIKNANPNNVFLINIHQGGFATPGAGQPDFRTSFGNAIANQTGLTGYPAATVNRTVFSGLGQSSGSTAMNRNYWNNASNQILAQSSYVNVALQAVINAQTNELTVIVETYYTGNSPVSTNRLNVALLQNNTLGPQVGGEMGNNYNHQHRLVHFLTGQWGTTISTTTAGSYDSQTFTYTIPQHYNNIPVEIGELELVAFVTETQQKIISGNGAKPTYTGLTDNDIKVKSIESISPQCINSIAPKVSIQNMSQTALTNLPISYNFNSGNNEVFNWTGNLAPLQSTVVQLPATSYNLLANNTLNILIPNDDDNSNNSGSINFVRAVATEKTNITIKITLDRYGYETTWNLRNSSGAIVAQNPNNYPEYGASNAYPQPDINLTLPNDCYTFSIADAYGDGMCCSYGNGGYQILADGVLIQGMSGGNFGTGESKTFEVNTTLSVAQFEADLINFYPNPTTGIVNFSLPESATVTITDLSGKSVLTSNLESGDSDLNLSSLAKGIYIINFAGDNYSKTDKIIIK